MSDLTINRVTLFPGLVDYRAGFGTGTRVVRVTVSPSHDLYDCRLSAHVEAYRPWGLDIAPLALSLNEVVSYINDALMRTQNPPTGNSPIGTVELSDYTAQGDH